jgi:hypothetical protein
MAGYADRFVFDGDDSAIFLTGVFIKSLYPKGRRNLFPVGASAG